MLTIIIIFVVIGIIYSKAANSKKENNAPLSIPKTVIIPRQIQNYQQLLSGVSGAQILTFFCYDNEIVEMRFANGKTFKKHLKDCSFQLGSERDGVKKRSRRVVQERIGTSFTDVNKDWAVTELPILSKQEWDRLFSILGSAGTTYGSYDW